MNERLLEYIPVETIGDLEQKELEAVGCVVCLLDSDGNIYVVEESDKQSGLGPPCETRKEREYILDNAGAALLEEVGLETPDLQNVLWIPGKSYLGRVPFGSDQVHADGDFLNPELYIQERIERQDLHR